MAIHIDHSGNSKTLSSDVNGINIDNVAITTASNTQILTNKTLTSPVINTSIVTGSTAVDVLNTIATSVNAFGAATTVNIGATTGTTTVKNNLAVTGNLTINGTTTTVNATTVTLDDPIITLGGDTAPTVDDNKDRGVEFRWHNGTNTKIGFFGFDDSTGFFTFIPDATNTSEVFSGDTGTIQAALLGNATTATTLQTARTISLSTGVTGTATSFDGSANISIPVTSVAASYLSGTIPSVVLSASTAYVGTTAITLNRASANQALTGISSIALPGSTSGTITVSPAAVAGTTTLTLPATTGTLITTGDSATVTNTMLAGSIDNAKLANSTISGVALGSNLNTLTIGTGLTGTSYNGSGAVTIAIDTTVATLTGTQTLTNKTLTAPVLGAATATSINKVTITAPTTGSTLTIADGKTLTASNTLTFTGTDAASVAFGAGGTVAYTSNINAGTLTLGIGTAGATNTTVTVGTGTGFNANTATNTTYDIKIGPALTALASIMTDATTGIIKKTAADTYTLDANTYLTTETDTLQSVTTRGATSDKAITLTNTTASTTTATGALIVSGGVGISGNLNVAQITSGSWNATAISATKGGTGLTSYAAGDIIYASAANTLTALPKGLDGKVLKLVGGLPAWSDGGSSATTIAGYGITDAYTKTQIDAMIGDISTLLGTL